MPKGVPKYGSKYKNMFFVGQQFGKWTVVDTHLHTVSKNASIRVRCTCGTERLVQCTRLLYNRSVGCECGIRGSMSPHWKGTNTISGRYISSIKISAAKRNIEWNVSNDYLESLIHTQNGRCKLSGEPIQFNPRYDLQTASLDRIDSSIGYVEGNLQWVHKNINLMKNVFSTSEFIHWCKLVYDNNRIALEIDEIPESERTSRLFRKT